jgi:hypothetical protein
MKEIEMAGSTRIGATRRNIGALTAIRRLAATALVGGLCLIATAVPVSAQTFGPLGGGGKIYGTADCYMATRTANVWVSVMEPKIYASSGLYFYTEIWAKSRDETRYNFISGGQSPLVKTWSPYSDGVNTNWGNNPTTIFSGSFTGSVQAYYDILVRYWYAPPGANWTGPYGFTLATDPSSRITIVSSWGQGAYPSDCFL